MKLLFNCCIKPCIINRRPYIIQRSALRGTGSSAGSFFRGFELYQKYNGLGAVFAGDSARTAESRAALAQPRRRGVRGALQGEGGRARRALQGRPHSCKARNSPQKDRRVFENEFSAEIKEVSNAGEENRV